MPAAATARELTLHDVYDVTLQIQEALGVFSNHVVDRLSHIEQTMVTKKELDERFKTFSVAIDKRFTETEQNIKADFAAELNERFGRHTLMMQAFIEDKNNDLRKELRTEFRSEFGNLRTEFRDDIGGLRSELCGKIEDKNNDLRDKLCGKIDGLRVGDLRNDFDDLRTELRLYAERHDMKLDILTNALVERKVLSRAVADRVLRIK